MEAKDQNSQGLGELRIVVGTDGSAGAMRAVEFAVKEAAQWGAILHVVTVYREESAEGGFILPLGLFQGSAEAVVSVALDRAQELEPGVVLKGEAVRGVPGTTLTTVSEGAASLVVGTCGHNELAGLLLGSVSEYVLHHATCTTIVVR